MVTLKDGNMINNMNARSLNYLVIPPKICSSKITRIIRNEDVPIVEDAINKSLAAKAWRKTPMLEVGVMKK